MSIAPFSTRPLSAQSERKRTRLAVAIATLGIAATLLAYAVSPGVRHAVGHAAHSVRHAVSRMLDRDGGQHARANRPAAHANRPPAHANRPPAGKPAARSDRSSVTHASSSPR